MTKTIVTVKQPEPPIRKEILAEAIVKVSEGFSALQASGLNREAIVVLVQAQTKISKRDINAILNALARLKSWYAR